MSNLFYLNNDKQIQEFDTEKYDNKTLAKFFDQIKDGEILLFEKIDMFSKLPKDLIIEIAMNYSLDEITKQCQVSKVFNKHICKNETFWEKRLFQDYQVYPKDIPEEYKKNIKEYYIFITKKTERI